jgi:hypothetical protein
MSNSRGARTIRLPSANFAQLKIPHTRLKRSVCFRVHRSGTSAIFPALNPVHRFSHVDCPYPMLYLAAEVDTCLFERFGDGSYDQQKVIAQSLWHGHSVSKITIPDTNICDLTHGKTLSAAMVDLAALMHPDISVPQQWGLAIQRHPAGFQGIAFRSRFDGNKCLALFKRDGMEEHWREKLQASLDDHEAAVSWLSKHQVSLY